MKRGKRMIQNDFIDYISATKAAVRAYSDMGYICASYDGFARAQNEDMIHPPGGGYSDTPTHGGGNKTEEAWCRGIDQKQMLIDKLAKAKAYMTWFKPAWERLTEEERIVLEEHYMHQRLAGSWLYSVQKRLESSNLPMERTKIYQVNERALERLSVLLFGL